MNRCAQMKSMVVAGILAGTMGLAADLPLSAGGIKDDILARQFQSPPASARPWVFWFWINCIVTREGITADLEAMKRVGIGGAYMMEAGYGPLHGLVKYNGPEWHALLKHAVAEAKRLGLELAIHNAPSWSGSGGPWITPENGMKIVVTSEKHLKGPARFDEVVSKPEGGSPEFYRDIAVLAFRTPDAELTHSREASPKVTVSTPGEDGAKVLDGKDDTFVKLDLPKRDKRPFIQFEFAQPYTAATLSFTVKRGFWAVNGQLQVSQDGQRFEPVTEFRFENREAELNKLYSFAPVTAKYFRLVLTQGSTTTSAMNYLGFAEVDLSPRLGIANLAGKVFRERETREFYLPPALPGPAEAAVQGDSIVNLTDKLSADGKLSWDIPAGNWTILRVGYTANGRKNYPAPPGSEGLECDKLSRRAVQAHWDGFISPILANLGSLVGKVSAGLNNIEIDSYEPGSQNWTDGFEQEFRRRRGYDLTPYLPVLTGRVVNSPELTERFLWDFRRTIADLFAENYAARMAELVHQAGLNFSIEHYGNGPFDDLEYGSYADMPMGTFWHRPAGWCRMNKVASSVAHVYGRTIVPSEALTSGGGWREDPFALKQLGDAAYCDGANRFVIHRFTHQPWTNRAPGMTLGPWGIHFERSNTWWEQSRAWLRYLARCQYLLQEGRFVADVVYYNGEGAPNSLRNNGLLKNVAGDISDGELPPGYDYDGCCTGALLAMRVKDGQVVLPSGMSYRLLALPPERTMTPAVLRKIKKLVEAGATVVGPKPDASPSLTEYPQCDTEVKKLAEAIWPRVRPGRPPEALAALGISPDLEWPAKTAKLKFIHRIREDADIYFVACPESKPLQIDCTFRVSGKQPELWHPDTGMIEPAPVFVEKDGRTTVPLRFDPVGSVFVVFRQPAPAEHATAFKRVGDKGATEPAARLILGEEGRLTVQTPAPGAFEITLASGRTLKAEVAAVPEPVEIAGPWELSFPPRLGAPAQVTLGKLISWTDHPDAGVKYFSGTATYRKSFDCPLPKAHCPLYLDLGELKNLAEVKLNGKDLGILWKPPFRLEVTGLLKEKGNELEVKITNQWVNRLIGDEQLPVDRDWAPKGTWTAFLKKVPQWVTEGKPSPTGRIAFTVYHHWDKDDKPLPSGLFGPVRLVSAAAVPVE